MKLLIEKPVYGGDCLAHVDGKAVFVPLTLPGEQVSAHVVEEKRNFSKAECDQVIAASVSRVAAVCRHFGACGGCHYQHADYPAQISLKKQILRETLERAGVRIPITMDHLAAEPLGYRNRIRLAVTEGGNIGYRSRRSHAIIPIHECPIAAPILLDTTKALLAFAVKRVSPVKLHEIELFTSADESQILLTVFCEIRPAPSSEEWLAALHAALPAPVIGIRLQQADGARAPMILAGSGAASMTYTAARFAYRVDHGAFFQVNRWLVDDFVVRIVSGTSGGLAWDLYAGVGLFARQLAASFKQVIAVESAPASFAALQSNLAGTTGQANSMTTLDFLHRNRQEREPRPDLIVMDPPRAGLGDETTTLLNAIHAPEMVYVSCDPATLARDLRALTRERYRVESVTLVDMFPQTFHLETIVRLKHA